MRLPWLRPLLLLVVVRVQAADEKPPVSPTSTARASATANDDQLRAVIGKVREAEDRYRNLETVVRITSEYKVNPADPHDPLNVETEETKAGE